MFSTAELPCLVRKDFSVELRNTLRKENQASCSVEKSK
jgi:hypothetical protein